MLPAITVQLLARKPEDGAPSGADGSGTLESAGRGWAIKNNLVWEQKASITAEDGGEYFLGHLGSRKEIDKHHFT